MKLTISYFLFPIFFLAIHSLNAQNKPDFDSIRAEIKRADSDWERIHNLILMGSRFSPSQADSIAYYSKTLAHEFDNNEFADAGKDYLYGLSLSKSGKFLQAEEPLKKAIEKFKKLENFRNYFAASNALGINYTRAKNIEAALEIYEDLLSQKNNLNSEMLKGVYGNLGIAYKRIGDFDKAITSFESAIEADPNDKFSLVNSYLNISNIFLILNQFDKALSTLNKIDISGLERSSIAVAYYINKGAIFERLNNADSAIYFYKKGISNAETLNLHHQTVKAGASLTRLYTKAGQYDLGKKLYNKTKYRCPRYCPPPQYLDVLLAGGELMIALQQFDSAILLLNNAITKAEQTKIAHLLNNVYKLLSTAHEQKGEDDIALKYQKKHNVFLDSINKLNEKRYLADARTKYDTEEKEERLNTAENEKSLFQNLFEHITLIAIFLLIGGIILYRRFLKSNDIIALKENQIRGLNTQLEEYKKRSEKVDAFPKYLILKSKAKIDLGKVYYIYVEGHYLEYYIQGKQRPEIDRNTISNIIEELPSSQFVRVHRSYVINVDFIEAIYATKVLMDNGKEIPVSRTFKSNLEGLLLNTTVNQNS